MALAERIACLQRLGKYTPTEAEFLCVAALHSGVFVMRQYREFCGSGKPGGRQRQLLMKALLQRQDVQLINAGRKVPTYKICASIHGAIGGTMRNWKSQRPDEMIEERVRTLDYVIRHYRGRRYLATEREKLEYFDALGIPRGLYPRRTWEIHNRAPAEHYFVERHPIFALPKSAGFVFIDDGRMESFYGFLDRYRSLFCALGGMRVVFVTANGPSIDTARRGFDRRMSGEADLNFVELELAFRRRADLEEMEKKSISSMDEDALNTLRECRSGPYQELFSTWQELGMDALRERLRRGIVEGAVFEGCCISGSTGRRSDQEGESSDEGCGLNSLSLSPQSSLDFADSV